MVVFDMLQCVHHLIFITLDFCSLICTRHAWSDQNLFISKACLVCGFIILVCMWKHAFMGWMYVYACGMLQTRCPYLRTHDHSTYIFTYTHSHLNRCADAQNSKHTTLRSSTFVSVNGRVSCEEPSKAPITPTLPTDKCNNGFIVSLFSVVFAAFSTPVSRRSSCWSAPAMVLSSAAHEARYDSTHVLVVFVISITSFPPHDATGTTMSGCFLIVSEFGSCGRCKLSASRKNNVSALAMQTFPLILALNSLPPLHMCMHCLSRGSIPPWSVALWSCISVTGKNSSSYV